MGGLCHVAAPSNASWVIMVITQPSEARPEAPGMTRSDRRAWDDRRNGGGGSGATGSRWGGAGLSRRCPINSGCHIRGRWMYVDIPSDLSSSTIKMLMRDDDKCLSSWVICAALTERRFGRVVPWKVKMCLCLDCRAVETGDYSTWDTLLQRQILMWLWKADWAVHHIIYFFSLLRRSENWERHRTKCSGRIWSIMGTRGPRDGGVHHHFQKLKSTSLYSLYCLTARTLWRQSPGTTNNWERNRTDSTFAAIDLSVHLWKNNTNLI